MNSDKDALPQPMLNLPVFEVPQRSHWPMWMRLEDIMDETEPMRQFYMKHFDSPEKRLRNKNPEPFRMHSPGDPILNLDKFGFVGPGGKLTAEEIDRIVYGA